MISFVSFFLCLFHLTSLISGTDFPTLSPTIHPTLLPTLQPTLYPTHHPTFRPTYYPTSQPSSKPSSKPFARPTSQPTSQPTEKPSKQPTSHPTSRPSSQPTTQPSSQPSQPPTSKPSSLPTKQPTSQPTIEPTSQPTSQPTNPTSQPTTQPSSQPSTQPTSVPTSQPTSMPTEIPLDGYIPDYEYNALYDLYNQTGGLYWTWNLQNGTKIPWDFSDSNPPICSQWAGITCSCNVYLKPTNHTKCVIKSLILNEFNLTHQIPATLSDLYELIHLNFANNELTGSLPDHSLYMVDLQDIYLQNNYLTGSLPMSLFQIINIKNINLANNLFFTTLISPIPYWPNITSFIITKNYFYDTININYFQHCPQIQVIELSENHFNGSIPSFSNLMNLTYLSLEENIFSGSIPSSNFVAMNKLTYLHLGHNAFEQFDFNILKTIPNLMILLLNNNDFFGSISDLFNYIPHLTRFNIDNNLFSGVLPTSLFTLTNITVLNLGDNCFTGPLPSNNQTNLTSLIYFNISNGGITGKVDTLFNHAINLRALSLRNNHFEGNLPRLLQSLRLFQCHLNYFTGKIRFPSNNNVSSLLLFDIGYNLISGTISSSFETSKLIKFDVSFNKMGGSLPMYFSSNQQIATLWLQNNQFIGSIPETFNSFEQLTNINVEFNSLSQPLPGTFLLLPNLKFVSLASNKFIGPLIDDETNSSASFTNFITLDISSNAFTGSIPSVILNSTALRSIIATSNCFSGSIPDTICTSTSLISIAFDGLASASACQHKILPGTIFPFKTSQSLNGKIPSCIFDLPHLFSLHLSGNGLRGQLPSTISPSIKDLSLSHNILTGTIPHNFQHQKFHNLDLSFNKISGLLVSDFSQRNITNITNTLSLQVNRLSGDIPSILKDMININILEGNIFYCNFYQTELPKHDSKLSVYSCGSDSINRAMIIWTTFVGFVIVLLFFFYSYYVVILSWFKMIVSWFKKDEKQQKKETNQNQDLGTMEENSIELASQQTKGREEGDDAAADNDDDDDDDGEDNNTVNIINILHTAIDTNSLHLSKSSKQSSRTTSTTSRNSISSVKTKDLPTYNIKNLIHFTKKTIVLKYPKISYNVLETIQNIEESLYLCYQYLENNFYYLCYKCILFSFGPEKSCHMINTFYLYYETAYDPSSLTPKLKFKYFLSFIGKRFVFISCFLVFIMLPLYCILSIDNSMFTINYGWIASGNLLTGLTPGIVMAIFYSFLIYFIVTIFDYQRYEKELLQYQDKYKNQESSLNKSDILSRDSMKCLSVDSNFEPDRYNSTSMDSSSIYSTTESIISVEDKELSSYGWIIFWSRISLLFINFLFNLGINIAYVLAIINVSSNAAMVIQIVVSAIRYLYGDIWIWMLYRILKASIFFQWSYLPNIQNSKEVENKIKNIYSSKLAYEYTSWDVFMMFIIMLFNNILFPLLATFLINSNCFYNAIAGNTPITKYYYYDCKNDLTGNCASYEFVELNVHYSPPFVYRYQCASTISMNYDAVNIYMSLPGIIIPFTIIFVKVFSKYIPKRIVDYWLPKTLYSIEELQKNKINDEESHEIIMNAISVEEIPIEFLDKTETNQEKEQLVSKKTSTWTHYINWMKITTQVSKPKIIDKVRIGVRIYSTISLLMIFGIIYPPLAFVLIVNLCINILFDQLCIGYFLNQCLNEPLNDDVTKKQYRKQIDKECSGFIDSWSYSFNIILIISSVFYGYLIFDTVGDQESLEVAGIIGLLNFVLLLIRLSWIWISMCLQWIKGKKNQEFSYDTEGTSNPIHNSISEINNTTNNIDNNDNNEEQGKKTMINVSTDQVYDERTSTLSLTVNPMLQEHISDNNEIELSNEEKMLPSRETMSLDNIYQDETISTNVINPMIELHQSKKHLNSTSDKTKEEIVHGSYSLNPFDQSDDEEQEESKERYSQFRKSLEITIQQTSEESINFVVLNEIKEIVSNEEKDELLTNSTNQQIEDNSLTMYPMILSEVMTNIEPNANNVNEINDINIKEIENNNVANPLHLNDNNLENDENVKDIN